MRREDVDMLAERYAEPVEDGSRQFRERLEVDCPEVARLSEAILRDLDPTRFGVGWWAGCLDAKRRILIGDCMYQAIDSVDDNLVEAKLHLLQLRHWYDEENRQNADVVYANPDTGEAAVRVVPPKSALDQLPSAMSTLHVVGTLQSLNTSLDCLAGGIVGICALPLDIQRASFGGTGLFLEGKARQKPNDVQVAFGQLATKHIADAGPAGWLRWMQQFRNANLHRGRRLNAKHLTQRHPLLLDPKGNVIPRVDTTTVLPAEPGFSEIQAYLRRRAPQLSEPALTTLLGCLNSTRDLIRAIASDLLELWLKRRSNPDWVTQPESQWASTSAPEGPGFDGYRPGTASAHMPTMVVHPSISRRMRAAALDEQNRHRWDDDFD